MKKSRLKSVSRKRAKQLAKYRKLKAEVLGVGSVCEFPGIPYCTKQAVDVHHANGRNGERLLDTKHWWILCREHHTWLHSHPREAKQLGLLK